MVDIEDRMYREIEIMTRRLELEKRRLQSIETDLKGAKETLEFRSNRGQIRKNDRRRQRGQRFTAEVEEPQQDSEVNSSASAASARPVSRAKTFAGARAASAGRTPRSRTGDAATATLGALLHRLDVQVKKLSSIKSNNGKLREEVNVLRRERAHLNGIFDRLKGDIKQRTGQLTAFGKEVLSSEEMLGEAQQRIAVMKRLREMDASAFRAQVFQVRRKLLACDFDRRKMEVELKSSSYEAPPLAYTGSFRHPALGDKDMEITITLDSQRRGHWIRKDKPEPITVTRYGDTISFKEVKGALMLEGSLVDAGGVKGIVHHKGYRAGRFVLKPKKAEQPPLNRFDGLQNKTDLVVAEEEKDLGPGWTKMMMRRIMKTAFLNCIQRRKLMQHEKNVEIYDQAFKKIKDETEISDPEEIVSKFAKLHTRNYSLLTYINHMNHETEALEAVRRERTAAEEAKRTRDAGHKATREHSLGDIERQLASLRHAIDQGKQEERRRHGLLNEKLIPPTEHMVKQLRQVPGHLPIRSATLSKAVMDADGDDIGEAPKTVFAREIREETLPQWLEWVEESLGRYRDLLKHGGHGEAFPATALEAVHELSAKPKLDKPPPLVRKEELPAANSGFNADSVLLTPAQRREQFEEDVDEEEFDTRPFKLKEIRLKAEEAIKRRKARQERSKHGGIIGAGNTSEDARQRSTSDELPNKSRGASEEQGRAVSSSLPAPLGYDGLVAQGGATRTTESEADLDQGLPPIQDDGSQEDEEQSLGDNDADRGRPRFRSRTEFLQSARGQNLAQAMQTRPTLHVLTEEQQFHKMSRDELRAMAERVGLTVEELCFLKSEFSLFDVDGSGYLDPKDLGALMARLGENLSEHALEQAFRELVAVHRGGVEFFAFVEWYTSAQGVE